MKELATTWGCYECDAGETGTDWPNLDKHAEKHVKTTGHPTYIHTQPA